LKNRRTTLVPGHRTGVSAPGSTVSVHGAGAGKPCSALDPVGAVWWYIV